jgi:hypothetical protein
MHVKHLCLLKILDLRILRIVGCQAQTNKVQQCLL